LPFTPVLLRRTLCTPRNPAFARLEFEAFYEAVKIFGQQLCFIQVLNFFLWEWLPATIIEAGMSLPQHSDR
jgi:hypothetical protein